MPMTPRLPSPPVDAEVSVSYQTAFSQKTSVGVDNLHYMSVVSAETELAGSKVGDEWSGWVETWK